MARIHTCLLVTLALTAMPATVGAQSSAGYGRFSLFAYAGERTWDGGSSRSFSELVANLTLRSPSLDEPGVEYAVDVRSSGQSGEQSSTRVSIYNAWVGVNTARGRLALRAGQMWLNELGGLGSLGGIQAEYRGRRSESGLRLRAALFAGAEPRRYDAGWVADVEKGGVYVALDGEQGRRHVLGWVQVRNSGLVERSVLTTQNFVSVGRTFSVYQAAEYDLEPPAGVGRQGLNYVYANLRWSPVRAFEVQTSYHHGRSIDARTITEDELEGRPIDPARADGYLFESARARLTFRLGRGVRLWGGYGQDRNNRDDEAHDRITVGAAVNNLFGSGIDVTASSNRFDRSTGSYTSYYASLGRSFGRRVYVSVDYNSSLNVVRITGGDGVTVETRPTSQRWSLSSNIRLNRTFGLLLNAERFDDDDSAENRLLAGITVRF